MVSDQCHAAAVLSPGKSSPILLERRLGGAGLDAIQLVAGRYTDWAIPALWHKVRLRNFYYPSNVITMITSATSRHTHGRDRKYIFWLLTPEGIGPFGRSQHKWKYNITVDSTEVAFDMKIFDQLSEHYVVKCSYDYETYFFFKVRVYI
jgi:hypothetical protein